MADSSIFVIVDRSGARAFVARDEELIKMVIVKVDSPLNRVVNLVERREVNEFDVGAPVSAQFDFQCNDQDCVLKLDFYRLLGSDRI